MSSPDARWRREARRAVRLARLALHVLTGLVLAHTLLPGLRWRHRPRGGDGLVRWWSHRLVRILGVEIVIEGRAPPPPVLFVSNHLSWLDIPVLRAAFDTTFVSKAEVRRWPAVGRLAHRAGTLFLERGRPEATARIAERMTWMLARGQSVLIFPEGTTSLGTSLRRFHGRLYSPAIHTGVSVQALALAYSDGAGPHAAVPFVDDQEFLPHLWALVASPRVVATVRCCQPVTAARRERRQLADATRLMVQNALGPGAPGGQSDIGVVAS